MSEPDRFVETFTIIRHTRDGSQQVAHGTLPEVTQHIPVNRLVKQKLQIINDSAVVERKQKARKQNSTRIKLTLTHMQIPSRKNQHGQCWWIWWARLMPLRAGWLRSRPEGPKTQKITCSRTHPDCLRPMTAS
jgi:hypothetical protein